MITREEIIDAVSAADTEEVYRLLGRLYWRWSPANDCNDMLANLICVALGVDELEKAEYQAEVAAVASHTEGRA